MAACFWHTEGWTPRHEAILEAVLKRAQATKHPWLVALDAKMSPGDFAKSLWFRKDRTRGSFNMQVKKCARRVG